MYFWGMTLASFWEEEAFWQADVGIVGGGLVGLSLAASLLERAPATRIVLLERGLTPLGASTRNAGFLCLGSPSEICRNLQQIGEAATVSLVAQRAAGLRRLRTRLGDAAIHYQPTGGYELIPSSYEWVLHELDHLNALLSEAIGGPYARLQDEKLPHFRFGEAIRHLIYLPHEGAVHSGFLVRSLWQYVAERGALILTGAEVEAWEEEAATVKIRVRDPYGRNGYLSARTAALCTNALAPHLTPACNAQPARGQILLTYPIEDLPWQGVFHVEEGYFYFRAVGKRILFGGGRHYDFAGETTTEFTTTETIRGILEAYLRDVIIPWRQVAVERWWAGIMGFCEPPLPKITWETDRVVSVFACNGMGVALSSVIADQAAEALLQRWG